MVETGYKAKQKRRRGRKSGGAIESPKSQTSGSMNSGESNGSSMLVYKPHFSPLIQPTEAEETWFEFGKQLPGRNATCASDPPPKSLGATFGVIVSKYRNLGDSIFQREMYIAGKDKGSNSDERWVESTMRKGTLKDRIAAMSVSASTDPIHKVYSLDGLLQMAGCSESGQKQTNSRVAQLAAEALEDLFLNTFLPPDRKLLTLNQRPIHLYESKDSKTGSKQTLSPKILLLWRFEEMIKEKFQRFLSHYLAYTLRDGMELSKVAALRTAAALMRQAPEGESQLLGMIVNKLGDPSKKTAATAGHELRRLLQQHPNMQVIVAREVQQLAHRPHLSSRALYNCVIFLNQLQFVREDRVKNKMTKTDDKSNVEASLPASLINTYFRLFELAVKSSSKTPISVSPEAGMKTRLLSALLAGVNRAHPYLPAKDQHMEEHIDALYRVVHTSPPGTSTQALLLLFHLAVGSRVKNDNYALEPSDASSRTSPSEAEIARRNRFYRALYSTLSNLTVLSSGKHLTMFFNLLYKAMKYDEDVTRVIVFAKRIMCTTIHSSGAPLAAGIFLINEISKHHPDLQKYLLSAPNQIAGTPPVFFDSAKREPRAALTCDNKEEDNDDSCAKRANSWELALISHHFHPSVSKFATTVGNIAYTGDPLKDFSLTAFLDKFAYRNPKSIERVTRRYKRGESVAERRGNLDDAVEAQTSLPFNDPSFLEKVDVNEQDLFFHKFFMERARRDKIKGIVRGKKNSVEDEEDALDAAEAKNVDKNYEALEQQWDTDSEEEAFVNSLSQKLLEQSAGVPVDLDDEDEDTNDWGDMYDDGRDEKSSKDGQNEDLGTDLALDDEEGIFMSKQYSPEDDDAFMDDSSDDSEGPAEQLGVDGDGTDESEERNEDTKEKSRQKKKQKFKDTFADADEYEQLINEAWSKKKRSSSIDGVEDEERKDVSSSRKEKKKRRRS